MIEISTRELKTLKVKWDGEERELHWDARSPYLLTNVIEVIERTTDYFTALAEARKTENLQEVRKVLEQGIETCEVCTSKLEAIFECDFGGVLCADVCLQLATVVNAETSRQLTAMAKERRR